MSMPVTRGWGEGVGRDDRFSDKSKDSPCSSIKAPWPRQSPELSHFPAAVQTSGTSKEVIQPPPRHNLEGYEFSLCSEPAEESAFNKLRLFSFKRKTPALPTAFCGPVGWSSCATGVVASRSTPWLDPPGLAFFDVLHLSFVVVWRGGFVTRDAEVFHSFPCQYHVNVSLTYRRECIRFQKTGNPDNFQPIAGISKGMRFPVSQRFQKPFQCHPQSQ